MLQRNRVALAWSAGLAMVLVMSSPASAQIQDPGLAWVTIDDSTGSPVFTFGQTNDQNGPSGLFDSSNSGPTGSEFIGQYYNDDPPVDGRTEIDFTDPQNGATIAVLTISFSTNDPTSPNNQIVKISYVTSPDGQLGSLSPDLSTVKVGGGFQSFGGSAIGAPANFVVNVGSADPSGVPEIDPASAGGALACLVSGVLMLTARRKRVTS